MNYNKLQLSFILLLIMLVIQLFVGIFILHKLWLILSSILVIALCLWGLIYTIRKEAQSLEQKKESSFK